MGEFFSGHVFLHDFPYVWSPYVEPYSFKRAVFFRFTFSGVLLGVAVTTVAVTRWLTTHLSGGRRTAFRFLSGLIALCPLTGMLVASVMIGRLIIDLGITPKRLLGFGCASGAVLSTVAFLWFTLRFREEQEAERVDGEGLGSAGAPPSPSS